MKRPVGPPRVWNVVNIQDANKVNREFTIQDIPEDRYDETLDHMCDFFLRNEVLSSSHNMAEDPISTSDIRRVWMKMVEKGFSIAAYDTTENKKKPILAGVNILFYSDDDFDQEMNTIQLQGKISKIIYNYTKQIYENVCPKKLYGVEGYLSAFGLSVAPNYARLGLAKILLETRDNICREYNIKCTSTLFTSPYAQKAAAHAGFVVQLDEPIENAVDETGQKLFPSLFGKNMKIMDKFFL